MVMHRENAPSPEVRDHSLSLSDYAFLVSATRKNDMSEDWQQSHAGFILDELNEVIYQHGPGLNLLLSGDHDHIIEQHGIDAEVLRNDIADELSDMLWFGFSAAEYLQQTTGSLICRGLEPHGITNINEPKTFADVQRLAVTHADTIFFRNKYSLESGDESSAGLISLADSPGYAFNRTTGRLTRALSGDRKDGPMSASQLEPQLAIDTALGEYLIVLSYIAPARLKRDIESIAWHNIQKLKERERWGKPDQELLVI